MLLQPLCTRCKRRHRPDLPHWWGAYATRASRAVLLTQGRCCWICGERATTADHVVPRSKGGDDDPANLRPACRKCNTARGNDDNPFTPEAPPRVVGVGLSERWRC